MGEVRIYHINSINKIFVSPLLLNGCFVSLFLVRKKHISLTFAGHKSSLSFRVTFLILAIPFDLPPSHPGFYFSVWLSMLVNRRFQISFPCGAHESYVHTALQELALKSISEQLLLPVESPLVAFCLLTECLGFLEEAHIYLSCLSMRIPVSNKSLCFRAKFPYRSRSLPYLYCCLTRCRH